MGKSLLESLKNEGGQNPIEAAKLGCKIYHGPFTYNFKDIYNQLKNLGISYEVKIEQSLSANLYQDFNKPKKNYGKSIKKINRIGNQILLKSLNEINYFLENENFKPDFWNKKKSLISITLIPISCIYSFLLFLRSKLIKTENFKIPIICIGNIYVGGTGKTPLAMEVYKIFKEKKYTPIIVKKYYINHVDEQEMIRGNNLSLISQKNRRKSIINAIEKKYDLIILDDGFQDLSINKNLNILCFKSNKFIGNGRLLPSGPLREKIGSLKRVQIVMINGNENKEFENEILSINKNIKIYYSNYIPLNLESFKLKKVVAFAGIGEPIRFYQLLEDNNVRIKKKFSFTIIIIKKLMKYVIRKK